MNAELEQNNYIRHSGLLTPQEAAELAMELQRAAEAGLCTRDAQAPRSMSVYNFLPFVRLLVDLVPVTSELCGEPVLPTYSYARIYRHGEALKAHRDRDACEISWTLHLAGDQEWPIFIARPDGQAAEIQLQPGDGALYLGCAALHWRETFAGQNFMQVFLHYVLARGSRAYAFFDRSKVPPLSGSRLQGL